MKVENIARSKELIDLLDQVDYAIKEADKIKQSDAFYIQEDTKGNGWQIPHIYNEDGNYDETFYEEIRELVVKKLKTKRENIIKEIEAL